MTYEHDIDYGTPAKKTDKAVTVEIDGRTITVFQVFVRQTVLKNMVHAVYV